ncbi:MAG: VOC family protein, partial [Hymenobacter sp.]
LNHSIFYVEFPSTDLAATKQFYQQAFGWKFEDYGPDYVSFANGPFCGGFYHAEGVQGRCPLVVLTAYDLDATLAAVEAAGGVISTPTFSFPGGRRFHFTDPTGNELAVCLYE